MYIANNTASDIVVSESTSETPPTFAGAALRVIKRWHQDPQKLPDQVSLARELSSLAEEDRTASLVEERNRMARELHDVLGLSFTAIFLQIRAARRFAERRPDVTQTCLARAEGLAKDGLRKARNSVLALQEEASVWLDLPATLQKLVEQCATDCPADCTLKIWGIPRPLPADVALHLLRIAQEALANSLRYAEASRIELTLHFEPTQVCLSLVDDGLGFHISPASKGDFGAGLSLMRQRAERIEGQFKLITAPGRGTAVKVWAPTGRPL